MSVGPAERPAGGAPSLARAAQRRPPTPGGPDEPHGFGAALARAVVWLRWPIVIAWIVGAVAASVTLPAIGSAGGLALTGLVPDDARSLTLELRSIDLFRVPILARTALVQRSPQGLSADAQTRALQRAATVAREPGRVAPLLLALPLVNQRPLLPFAREDATTVVTLLFFSPDASLVDQEEAAARYLALLPPTADDAVVGTTGAGPANLAQGREIMDALPLVEAATIALIALVMAIGFRSFGAPLITLAVAGAALVVTRHMAAVAGEAVGVGVPGEVEPLVVVLLLAIVTDYAIFFLSAMRPRLAAGETRIQAASRTTAKVSPIVLAAGLTVAACTAALLAGRLEFFRALGPGLAVTALVGMLAALTLLPALLAIFGKGVFWPRCPQPDAPGVAADGEPPAWRLWLARVSTRRVVALPVALLCLGGLAVATYWLPRTSLGITLIRGLEDDSTSRRAADAAALGIAPGVVAPTELVVEAPGVAANQAALLRLGRLVQEEPGVAGVVGPGATAGIEQVEAFVTSDGAAARYAVIFDSDPQGGRAIDDLRDLEQRLPALLAESGLGGATAGLAGDTALAAETIDAIGEDGLRVGVAAAVIGFLLLAIFLRALIAPLYLLAVSVAALAAALGLTTLIVQEVLGTDLTYYVPFAAAVLLFALGSDYNIFVVGRIWDEAKTRPLKEAIALSVPRSGKALTAAGLTLAGSFALLALVPLAAFRELAIVMTIGVLIDTFVVRPFLVPALVAIVGRASGWPGRRLKDPVPAGPEAR